MKYFENLKTYCFFIAPSRSGHSIIAHILSAHPHILFCDELDALAYFDDGFSANQVYALIKYQNSRHGKKGGRKSGYSYAIPGSLQYAWDKYPEVIGDAKGRRSSERIAQDPAFLDRLRKETGKKIRAIVQARHPYAMVASEMRNRGISLTEAVDNITGDIRNMDEAVKHIPAEEQTAIYQEDLLKDPVRYIRELFVFLGVDPSDEYVNLCSSKIWRSPGKKKKKKKKTKERRKQNPDLDRLDQVMAQSPLFKRYVEDEKLRRTTLIRKPKDAVKKWIIRKLRGMRG